MTAPSAFSPSGSPAGSAGGAGRLGGRTGTPPLRLEEVPGHPDFVPLWRLPEVVVDLRYAGANNLLGRNLYAGLNCGYLRREAAAGLRAAAAWLSAQRPGWQILLLDALRPQRVQEYLWSQVRGTPMQPYFASPQRGSIHSFGMAADVTLLDAGRREVDMGTGYDAITPLSHPSLEADHLARGLLTPAHLQRRGLLRAAMKAGGFVAIPNEWWHFDHGSAEAVRRGLPRVL